MAAERNFKLILEYDGADLAGWQRQNDQRTVQGHLEQALGRLTGQPVSVIGAGRTDAGVHARGQAANFRTSAPRTPDEIWKGANALLPPDIAVIEVREVGWDFHARYDAQSKVYHYDLDLGPVRSPLKRRYAWRPPHPVDLGRVRSMLPDLIGRQDFACFQSTGSEVKTSVRTMTRADLIDLGPDAHRLAFEADGFLRHMVRAMVGTLVYFSRPAAGVPCLVDVLASKNRDRAGPTAPPQGLCLDRVRY